MEGLPVCKEKQRRRNLWGWWLGGEETGETLVVLKKIKQTQIVIKSSRI